MQKYKYYSKRLKNGRRKIHAALIDELLKPRGVDRRNARYYIDGKEVPASTAYQTNIEQMEVKTGADGTLEIYIKPMIFIRGEYE